MATFSRGETTIQYEVSGDGPALLTFAPGGMRSSSAVWGRAPFHPVAELSGQFRVITMDQRNAGASRAPIGAADGWHNYTDDHLALLDELHIERCHLLGMCIGGSFSLSLIARAPERVRSAVLLQPVGASDANRAVFYELFDGWAAELMPTRSDVSPDALPEFRQRMFGGGFVFSVGAEAVAQCPVPLLVCRGNDLYHPALISDEIVRLAPRAELIHDWKTGEDLPRAVARVRAFLSEH